MKNHLIFLNVVIAYQIFFTLSCPWMENPKSGKVSFYLVLLSLFVQHVMYLRELRLAQMERLLAEFLYGVNIYLSVVRDANDVNPKVRSCEIVKGLLV